MNQEITIRILIIEDEKELLGNISKGLKLKGYAVDQAENGITGCQMAIDEEYDLIVLDLNLPGLDRIIDFQMLAVSHNI